MNFTCPYCGNGSFVVTHDGEGSSLATCGKCKKVIPFEKYMMTNSPGSEEARPEAEATARSTEAIALQTQRGTQVNSRSPGRLPSPNLD